MMPTIWRTGLTILLLWFAASTQAASCWPEWEQFRSQFVRTDGRVVDTSSPRKITTSEGQSYALFFALVANDRSTFDRVLTWTENNLANGDLTARLPAWQWGLRDDGRWQVIDSNAASDSDLWIAYALTEAGRLWREPRYHALAGTLAGRILREETTVLPDFGLTLLPGPYGFHPQANTWRVNPSYVPLQVLRRLASAHPRREWDELVQTSHRMLLTTAQDGYAPDWARYETGRKWVSDGDSRDIGSYNAIRVYLWAGTLAEDEPLRTSLLRALRPMAALTARLGYPPEEVQVRSGEHRGVGPAGFSASMMPLLHALGMKDAAREQAQRLLAMQPLNKTDNYYDQVLTLFATGWQHGRYRYTRDGALRTNWHACRTR